MNTLTMEHLREIRGAPVVDANADKLGTVDQIYLDVRTDMPQWIALKAGVFGGRATFVPLEGATIEGNTIQVPFTKDQVEASPDVVPDAISPRAEQALHQHYGVRPFGAGTPEQQAQAAPAEYGQPTGSGQPTGYGQPAGYGEPAREPLSARLRRWEWESRQR